jgi:hypothetical protein
MGDGDDHQGDEEPEPVASSTSDAMNRDAERHAEVPLLVSVLVRLVDASYFRQAGGRWVAGW